MKVLPFTILYPNEKSIIAERILDTHFYPHLHRHDELQMTWIVRGKGIVISGNNLHDFCPGDIFMFGSNIPHLLRGNTDEAGMASNEIEAYTIYFNLKAGIGAILNLPEMRSANRIFEDYKSGFKLNGKPAAKIAKIMAHIYQAEHDQVLLGFIALVKELQKIGKVQPLCPFDYAPQMTENEGQRLGNVINFIMEHYHRPISLEEASSQVFMTPGAFCRYFKKHTGRNLVSFVNEVRINEACKHLTVGNGTDSIGELSSRIGFNSLNNFNRVFKNLVGLSPRNYLERYRTLSRAS